MLELNNNEIMFLKLMNIVYNDDKSLETLDHKQFHFVGRHMTNGISDIIIYEAGDCILSIVYDINKYALSHEESKVKTINVIIGDIQYTLEESRLKDGLTKLVISAGTYRSDDMTSIEIVPDSTMENYAYLTTTVIGINNDLGFSIIDCSVSNIIDLERGLELDASASNYLNILQEVINNICDQRPEIKDFFVKMMPFYRSTYKELEVIPVIYRNNYLNMLERKTNDIRMYANGINLEVENLRLRQLLFLNSQRGVSNQRLNIIEKGHAFRIRELQLDEDAALKKITWERGNLYACIDLYKEKNKDASINLDRTNIELKNDEIEFLKSSGVASIKGLFIDLKSKGTLRPLPEESAVTLDNGRECIRTYIGNSVLKIVWNSESRSFIVLDPLQARYTFSSRYNDDSITKEITFMQNFVNKEYKVLLTFNGTSDDNKPYLSIASNKRYITIDNLDGKKVISSYENDNLVAVEQLNSKNLEDEVTWVIQGNKNEQAIQKLSGFSTLLSRIIPEELFEEERRKLSENRKSDGRILKNEEILRILKSETKDKGALEKSTDTV